MVLAIFCCGVGGIPGIVGWVMVNGELKNLAPDQIYDQQRDRLKIARILCVIATGILALIGLANLIEKLIN